jgi:hypothetical protein
VVSWLIPWSVLVVVLTKYPRKNSSTERFDVCLRIMVSDTSCVVLFCFVCLRLVSCVPNVASFSRLSILDCPFGFL